jgi:predicted RNA-binding Zn-ribbon protein involved in translation (DUF1610 family)
MLTQASASNDSDELHTSGEHIAEARPGTLNCVGCGWGFSPQPLDSLPECPNCGGTEFRRASLFSHPTIDMTGLDVVENECEWLAEARAEIDAPGHYLAFDEGGGDYVVLRLEAGWTRIGRSAAADVRLDDPTVSRRHALLVLTDTGELRALDDRSLNGLLVNGEQVDWAALADGDELEVGRYHLHVIRT